MFIITPSGCTLEFLVYSAGIGSSSSFYHRYSSHSMNFQLLPIVTIPKSGLYRDVSSKLQTVQASVYPLGYLAGTSRPQMSTKHLLISISLNSSPYFISQWREVKFAYRDTFVPLLVSLKCVNLLTSSSYSRPSPLLILCKNLKLIFLLALLPPTVHSAHSNQSYHLKTNLVTSALRTCLVLPWPYKAWPLLPLPSLIPLSLFTHKDPTKWYVFCSSNIPTTRPLHLFSLPKMPFPQHYR